jgi:hypothetical protein
MPEPIRMSFEVGCSRPHAFATWTRQDLELVLPVAHQWDRADATEVEISFHELGRERTRVDIEHRGWERLGAGADGWRDRNVAAWGSLLPRYREALVAAGA